MELEPIYGDAPCLRIYVHNNGNVPVVLKRVLIADKGYFRPVVYDIAQGPAAVLPPHHGHAFEPTSIMTVGVESVQVITTAGKVYAATVPPNTMQAGCKLTQQLLMAVLEIAFPDRDVRMLPFSMTESDRMGGASSATWDFAPLLRGERMLLPRTLPNDAALTFAKSAQNYPELFEVSIARDRIDVLWAQNVYEAAQGNGFVRGTPEYAEFVKSVLPAKQRLKAAPAPALQQESGN